MKNPSIASDNAVSDGQIETCVTLVTDATRKATGTAFRELARRRVFTKENVERVRKRGHEVVAAVTELVKRKFAELAENIFGYVRLISGAETLTLDPTDGTETFANAGALFTGGLDANFKNYGTDVPGPATEKMEVSVCEMVNNGTFADIFNGFGVPLDRLFLTQAQAIQFVRKYPAWLHPEGWATFILFKVTLNKGTPEEKDEFFVAGVYRLERGLLACVSRFSCDRVWFAGFRRRVVVPQQALWS